MSKLLHPFIIVLLFVAGYAHAQDMHFSQFNAAPLQLNPALAGVNGCSYRFVTNYKMQWAGIANYRTIAASYDMALMKNKPRSNFGGIGISAFSDKAGDSELTTNQVNLSLSYTVLLNRKGTQFLSGGIVGGFGQRTINYANLTFDSQFNSYTGFDSNQSNQENFATDNRTFADAGAGFLWNYSTDKTTNFYLGAAVVHVNQPNLSFMGARDEQLYMRFTVHGGSHFAVSNQWFLLPSFMFLSQGPHTELNAGTMVKMRTSILPTDKTAVYLGGWYRFGDGIIASARVDFAGFNVGLSYDLTVSKLTPATRLNGGPELSLTYTGCFPNKKKLVYCPYL